MSSRLRMILVLFPLAVSSFVVLEGSGLSSEGVLSGTQNLYAVTSSCDSLYVIETPTGEITTVGEYGSPGHFVSTSLASDLDGTLYTVSHDFGELYTLDKLTGRSSPVGGPRIGFMGGLAFTPVEVPGPGGTLLPPGTLFGALTKLVVINKHTGETMSIGSLGLGLVAGGIAFRSDGTLFGAELSTGSHDRLVMIDTATGDVTVIGMIQGFDFDVIGGLAFTSDDRLLGSDINTPAIFELDQATGHIVDWLSIDPCRLQGLGPQGLAILNMQSVPVVPTTWGGLKARYP